MEIEPNYSIDNNSSENNLPVDATKDKGYLKIPMCEDDFKGFISSLLGKPQMIEGVFNGRYSIDTKIVEDIHYILTQRLEQQNKSHLVQFTATIFYSDNSSVTLTSFQSFITYREVKPVVSNGLSISWIYLVQFEGKSSPEKQEIELLFRTDDYYKRGFIQNRIQYISDIEGSVAYRVKHTARTWGEDIEALLVKFIKSITIEPNKIKNFIVKKSGYVGFLSGLFIFALSNWGNYVGYKSFSNNAIQQVNSYLSSSLPNIDSKIDFIANYLAEGQWTQFNIVSNLFTSIMIFISISLGLFVSFSLDINEPSYILLTSESEKNKTKSERRIKKNWTIATLSIIGSIVIGVISNYIFSFLTKP